MLIQFLSVPFLKIKTGMILKEIMIIIPINNMRIHHVISIRSKKVAFELNYSKH